MDGRTNVMITPQLRSSARKDGETNMMITYDVTPQLRSSARNAYNFVAPGATKSHTTLGEIVRLYNCAVVEEGFG